MRKNDLPTYAIVELLMRIAPFNEIIGNYKDHHIKQAEVLVKTTGGYISFPQELIMQQFKDPEQINDHLLLQTVDTFRPVK